MGVFTALYGPDWEARHSELRGSVRSARDHLNDLDAVRWVRALGHTLDGVAKGIGGAWKDDRDGGPVVGRGRRRATASASVLDGRRTHQEEVRADRQNEKGEGDGRHGAATNRARKFLGGTGGLVGADVVVWGAECQNVLSEREADAADAFGTHSECEVERGRLSKR